MLGLGGHFNSIELLTADEVAAFWGISSQTVYRKIHSGELPSVHFGRKFRIPATAVAGYPLPSRESPTTRDES
ncbi:helix-turn-helix domain-containing protein [Arthrobacter sp. H14]|uniref:helix-turn-helix domain-containing protein n=1 Tax=Arthrobacter sp. H14 TaxID=1312959 RepID=UPI0004B0395B|nr:helix-turn-helix domain-containing protein [Arthrobacter sp. H14]